MIRMNPAHDVTNPPGCTKYNGQENVQHQDKPLIKEIDDYKRGFDDGVAFATAQKLAKYDPFVLGEFGR